MNLLESNSQVVLRFPRQVGHTTALLDGAKNTDSIVLAANRHHAKILESMGAKKATPYYDLTLPRLGKPMVYDHFTVETMVLELNAETEKYADDQLKEFAQFVITTIQNGDVVAKDRKDQAKARLLTPALHRFTKIWINKLLKDFKEQR